MQKRSAAVKRLLLLSSAILAFWVIIGTVSMIEVKSASAATTAEIAVSSAEADQEVSVSETQDGSLPIDPNAAARVNGVAISRSDLDKSYNNRIQQKGMDTQMITNPDRYKEVQLEVLDGLISRELLWQEAQKKNFIADDEDVKKAMIRAKNSFPSETEYKLHLAINRYTENDFAEYLRKQLSVGELIQKDIASGLSVSDDEVHAYYISNPGRFRTTEQVRARHILIKVDRTADEASRTEAKKKIEDILNEANSGADFAELAKMHSQAPSGPQGGDLGFFARGKMVKPFEEAAFALAPGEISGVVQTRYGYHIIKVEEKKEPGILAEKDVRQQVRQFLYEGKVHGAIQERINNLREAAKIEILLP